MSLSEIEEADFYFLLDVFYEVDNQKKEEQVTYAEDVPWL